MTSRLSRPRRRTGRRWTTSQRSACPAEAQHLRATLDESPRFLTAVRADTAITARFRGEDEEFRSDLVALAQAVRLAWITDSFLAQVCYRAEVGCRRRHLPVLPAVLHRLSMVTGQLSIGSLVVMRPGVYIPHGQVVIDGLTIIETGAVLRPFVTIGTRDGTQSGPVIGPRARIGTGARVIGPIRVGEAAQVGANAVVTVDVPDGCTAVGVPARVLEQRSNA